MAPEAAESAAIDAEPMAADALASGIEDGVVVVVVEGVVVVAGVVVVVVALSSFLLQPASAARLNEMAAMNVSDRM